MFKNENVKKMDDLERFLLENTIISIDQNPNDGMFTIKGANGSLMQTKVDGASNKIKRYFEKYAYDVETLADNMYEIKNYELVVSNDQDCIVWYRFNVEEKEVESVKRKVGVITINNLGIESSDKQGCLFETEIKKLKPWLLKCFSAENQTAFSSYPEGDQYKIICGNFLISSSSSLAIPFLSKLKAEYNELFQKGKEKISMQKKLY